MMLGEREYGAFKNIDDNYPKYVLSMDKLDFSQNGIIHKNARELLFLNSGKENEICKKCNIKKRCKHTCPCKNFILTNDVNMLSPIVCELEKIIIEIADEMASELYSRNSKLFIQKFYNKNYDILNDIINYRGKE